MAVWSTPAQRENYPSVFSSVRVSARLPGSRPANHSPAPSLRATATRRPHVSEGRVTWVPVHYYWTVGKSVLPAYAQQFLKLLIGGIN